ncbi:MAG TPA: acyl-ACP--UDP-N-acetylglucosamine O-acyltransferase [Chthoniobacterales bacterium]
MKIHPTAVIDPSATLGSDVEIGAYVVVGEGVEVGDGTILHPHVVLCRGVRLGEKNTVHSGAILGGQPQDLGFSPDTRSFVEIGNRNTIREHVTIHRGSKANSVTRVGHDCFLMAGAHLGHDVQLGSRVILANNCLLGGFAVVEDRVFMGGGSVLHQHTRVGQLAMIQGLSGFSKDVPPFTIAAGRNGVAGLNIVGLRRAGFDMAARAEIKEAWKLVFRSGQNVRQALVSARERTWRAETESFFCFIESSKRGICDLRITSVDVSGEV